ncbi:MAG TPA: RNA-binding protein [Kofleriaceae bacterium]|jgi:RNA recognition motif-containing protein|nr:RNA-binding protein [Kofleriaceae bacterium]
MSTRLFVGNLPFHATEDLLQQTFLACGEVKEVAVVLDRVTGRSRGFAFVEMGSPEAAQKAIQELDGQDLGGRPLRVNMAEERRDGGGGRGGSGGGGRRGPRR